MKPKSLHRKTTTSCIQLIALLLLSTLSFAQPVAQFTASQTSACTPSVINFTDQSSGNPTYWKWDLGNGTVSYLQNPSVSYLTAGQYAIKLIVRNASGTDSITKVNYITINATPVVAFTASNNTGCYPLGVQFNSTSTTTSGTISGYNWDFGDGRTSTSATPSHTYVESGIFNVTLKVTTSNGCIGSQLQNSLVRVNGVKANFNNTVLHRCVPTRIEMQSTSVGNGTLTYNWNYGDGNTSNLATNIHTYFIGGQYNVKLKVQNEFGCKDSLTRSIFVDTLVTAAFSSTNPVACRPPLDVNFFSPQKYGNTYLWSFGDGTTSTAMSPNHVYTDTGHYTVRLKVVNVNGCSDSLETRSYVHIKQPFAFLENLPDSSCSNFTKDFYVNTLLEDTITSYKWDFGDGTTSTAAAPSHTYSNLGYYHVKLIATNTQGCTDTVIVNNAIKISTKPVANFTTSVTNSCAKDPVPFTNLSTGATKYQWGFGNNGSSEVLNPNYAFKDTGWMNVFLIAWNGGCSDTMIKPRYVYIKPSVAKFTFAYECGNPFKVRFTNVSIGDETYKWTFGDGDSTSIVRSPSHVYPRQGVFNVTLYTYNNTTGCSNSMSKQIVISDAMSSFDANITRVCRGGSVTFTSTSDSSNVSRYTWDFGDGTSRVATRTKSVNHVFAKPGVYSIMLYVTTLTNCRDTMIRTGYITVDGPTAKFGLSSLGACINTPYSFTDSSTTDGRSAIVDWRWNFGDGTIQHFAAPPFTHTYNAEGYYTASLKVTDAQGCADSITTTKRVRAVGISTQMVVSDTLLCATKPIRFGAVFASQGFGYKWDFGDGTFSTLQTPTKSYLREGNFNVKLVISNYAGCSDSITKPRLIRIANPAARFYINDSFRTCPPLIVNFVDSSVNIVSKTWYFDDGSSTTSENPSHFYSYPGHYYPKLVVKGYGGCESEFIRSVVVNGPRGTINYNTIASCSPYQINFMAQTQDAVMYTWDFNDGVTENNFIANHSHTYENPGKYLPKLILVDAEGCRVSIVGRDSILAATVKTSFTADIINSCDAGLVRFHNATTTNDSINRYQWRFGDGQVSTEANPAHQYAQDGTYRVSLVAITNTGCMDSSSLVISVRSVPPPAIQINASNNGCAPLTANFQGVLLSADTGRIEWRWDFGNGVISNLQNPGGQIFTQPGVYTVHLSATNRVGCTQVITKTIEAYAAPVLQSGSDTTICAGQQVSLRIQGAATYQWTGQGLSCYNCENPQVLPLVDSRFIVKGTDFNGCFSFDTVMVYVKKPAKLSGTTTNVVCKGEAKRLSVNGALEYKWTPTTGLSNPNIANPIASPSVTTSYLVTGSNNNTCEVDSLRVLVKVENNPTVNAGADKTINLGTTVDLDPIVSADVVEVFWSPTDNLSRNGYFGITVRPTQNTEYTVEAKNAAGCAAKDKVVVSVGCDAKNIFIPNTFSPNGDGINDIFYVRGVGLQKIRNIRIFNRWGELVFSKDGVSANDPAFGWDGRFKGHMMSTDVFIYMVDVVCGNGTVFSYTGNLSLIN